MVLPSAMIGKIKLHQTLLCFWISCNGRKLPANCTCLFPAFSLLLCLMISLLYPGRRSSLVWRWVNLICYGLMILASMLEMRFVCYLVCGRWLIYNYHQTLYNCYVHDASSDATSPLLILDFCNHFYIFLMSCSYDFIIYAREGIFYYSCWTPHLTSSSRGYTLWYWYSV